jgi:hypothetical protein
METKQQQQKTPITKKSDLNLDAFLHSVICLPLKEINKHSIFNLGDTTDVMFSLIDVLDFNPINNHHKSRAFSCTNGTIQDITFKFRTRINMRLIFDSFYAPRKKRRLFNRLALMCDLNLLQLFNLEFYIDFISLFFFLIFAYFFSFFFSSKFCLHFLEFCYFFLFCITYLGDLEVPFNVHMRHVGNTI